jgi:hypothetical protein
MLLQLGTEERPTGWAETGTTPGPKTIDNLGTAPYQVNEFNGLVTLKRADAGSLTVSPLDLNGYRTDDPPINGAANISLQPDVMYYLIED